MTAEIVLLIALFAATVLAAGVGALIVATLGQSGWIVVAGGVLVVAVLWRYAVAQPTARNGWMNEKAGDEWRAG